VKTISIKKRLALGTVVAVAAGLLTTVSTTTANAAAATWSDGSSQLVQWLSNDASGAPTLGTSSVGLIGTSFTAQTGSAPASGVMLASGRLAFNVQIANGVARDTYVVTGGQIIGAAAVQPGTSGTVSVSVNTDGSKVDVYESVIGVGTLGGAQLLIAPTVAAGGVIQIMRYTGVSAQYAADTSPTFRAVVSIAASSTAGGYSSSNSYAVLNAVAASTQAGSGATVDNIAGFVAPNGYIGGLSFKIRDAYLQATAPGLLSVSSDNCYVGFTTSYPTNKSAYSAAYSSAAEGYVGVRQSVANTAATCSVTLSFDGTVVATKTIKFLGDVATANAVAVNVQSSDTAANNNDALAVAYSILYKDAAGNIVPTVSEANGSVDSGLNQYVTGVNAQSAPTFARSQIGKGQTGYLTCAAAGTASLVFKTTNAAGATIKSAPITVTCAPDAAQYSIKLDKDSYATGDIATITVHVTDSKGKSPVADVTQVQGTGLDTVSAPCATADIPTVASAAFSSLVAAPSCNDAPAGGVITYKAIVGQTAGTFQVAVNIPGYNSYGSPQTATIKVTAAAAAANPDITALVNVVGTLLTSFTKQISALIKALSKKK